MKKIVSLSSGAGHCPVVEMTDDYVKIGENDNICTLTVDQWGRLRQKILDGEL